MVFAAPVSEAARRLSRPEKPSIGFLRAPALARSGIHGEMVMCSKTVLSAGVFALLLATTAHAHHPGGTGSTSGAGPISTLSAETLEQGQLAVAFLYEYVSLFGLKDADLIAAA